MFKPKNLIILSLCSIFLVACVPQKKYDALQAQFDAQYAQNQKCQNDLTAALTRASSLEQQITDVKNNLKTCQDQLSECFAAIKEGEKGQQVNISRLIDQIESSNKYIRHLQSLKDKNDSLNLVLTNALTKSLSNQELKDIDVVVQKGVVFISLSDEMLFTSGSYDVNARAFETLSKVAKIIKDYPDFDVLVEGNTDNVPISKTNIRNNWDLSALRASSVVQVLQTRFNVNPKRMTAGGRGEFNPLASNDTATGRAENRRTQIIILPQLDQFMELIGQGPKNETVGK